MNFALQIGSRTLRITTGGAPRSDASTLHAPRSPNKRMFAAAQTNRLTADWPITLTSADAEIMLSAVAVRSRLRQLERDEDYTRNMLMLMENNVVGDCGIRLRMKVRSPDGTLDKPTNEATESAWADYCEEQNCTVTRSLMGQQVQRLAIRALCRDGAILLRRRLAFSNPYAFALEPIEIDRLDHWYNRPAVGTANEIKFGIELDQFKAPIAYWILTRHPGDTFAYSSSPRYRDRVPADEIIPFWLIERAGQTIGMPIWPSIAKRLHNLSKYEEAEQIAARVASAKGGWFKRAVASGEYVGGEDIQGNKISDTEPGQWEELPLGWEPVENDPQHPTDAFPHFLKSQLRGGSAGASLPYNSVASDLENVSYSAYKAGRFDVQDVWKWLQLVLAKKIMRPWFRSWLPYAVLSGKLNLPIEQLQKFQNADSWKPRRWAGLEPLKETQACVLAVESGFDSIRNIIEEHYDRDIEEVFDEQAHDKALAKEHGLDFSKAVRLKPTVGLADQQQQDHDDGRAVSPLTAARNGLSKLFLQD